MGILGNLIADVARWYIEENVEPSAWQSTEYMSKRKSYGILIIMFLVLTGGCLLQTLVKPKKESCEKQIFAMNTVMTFHAYGENAEEAVDAAIDEINRLSSLLSINEETSEVFALNEKGEGIVSEDTAIILERALNIYEQTEGAFDCTIYPLMKLWGFPTKEYHVPSEQEIEETLLLVDSSEIKISDMKLEKSEEETIKSENITSKYVQLGENQEIDLGGIAKGYASDRAIEIFKAYGMESGMVSLGGNIKTLNKKADGTAWNIGVRDPNGESTDSIAAIKVENKAVVTSGGYERYFEENGETYIHIIDTLTGYPAENGIVSATVVSEDGMLADALSTSLYIMGIEKSIVFWKNSTEKFEMLLITEEGETLVTAGLEGSISVKGGYRVIE